jgi:hypothetical protein
MARPEKFSPEQVAALKQELCDRIANGSTMTQAMRDLRLGWRRLARWRSIDPAFAELIDMATEYLTEREVDRLKVLHLEHPDPLVCEMAGKQLRWWIERRGRKAEAQRAQAPVHEVLREAVKRRLASGA